MEYQHNRLHPNGQGDLPMTDKEIKEKLGDIDLNKGDSHISKIEEIVKEIYDNSRDYEIELKYAKEDYDFFVVSKIENGINELYQQLKYICNYYIPRKGYYLNFIKICLANGTLIRFKLNTQQKKEEKKINEILDKGIENHLLKSKKKFYEKYYEKYKNDTHTPDKLFIIHKPEYIGIGDIDYRDTWCIFNTYEYKRVCEIIDIRLNNADNYDKILLDELNNFYYTEIIFHGYRRRSCMMSNYKTYITPNPKDEMFNGHLYCRYLKILDKTKCNKKKKLIEEEYKKIVDEIQVALDYHKNLTKNRSKEKIKCDLCGKLISRGYMKTHKKKCKNNK